MFRSKHIASLNEMTFCIMSFLLFLPKTDLKHSRAQYEKSMFLLLFTVVLSTSLSGNENQNLSLVAFTPHSFWYQKHIENQTKLSTGSKSNPVCCHTQFSHQLWPPKPHQNHANSSSKASKNKTKIEPRQKHEFWRCNPGRGSQFSAPGRGFWGFVYI